MAGMTTLAVIGAATSVIGGVMQYQAQKKQAKAMKAQAAAQNRAIAAQQKQAEAQNARARRDAIRRARIQRATALATAGAQGVEFGSSSVAGGVGAIGSNTAADIGLQSQLGALNADRNVALQQAASYGASAAGYASKAASYGAISSFGGTVFQQAGGFGSIFTPAPKNPGTA